MYSRTSLHTERNWGDAPSEYRWDHLSYRVRVRSNGTVALWGTLATTAQPITLPAALICHIHNDESGQPVNVGTQAGAPTGTPTETSYGTLQPGGCISIPVQSISAVTASCTNNTTTTVTCCIKTS
jgi:hypothetical protein